MKFFVLNSSGNVGKSLVSRELLYPRLKDALIIEVETVNKGSKEMDGLNVEQFKSGEDFTTVYLRTMEVDNVIVDVGASNLSAFWEQMQAFAGVEETFDFFIIPTVPAEKEMTDTFKTIQFLKSEGIPEEKIKVVFNKVKTSVAVDFEVLLSAPFPFNESIAINENASLFNDLGFLGKTIKDIYNPDVNGYKELIMAESLGAEKLKLVKMDLANRQAVKVKENMDVIFSEITGVEPLWIGEASQKAIKPSKAVKKPIKKVKEDEEVSEDDEEL